MRGPRLALAELIPRRFIYHPFLQPFSPPSLLGTCCVLGLPLGPGVNA